MRRRGYLFLVAFCVYNLNLRPIPSGDTAPAALLPFSIVAGHTITFDRMAIWYRETQHMKPAWFTRAADGHYYSSFPIALPLVLTPFYAPFVAFFDVQHMPIERLVMLARVFEKVSASLIAALSVVAFLALGERLANARTAWLLTAVYAFGSPTWSTSSQALWQHGACELVIILGLICLIRQSQTPESDLPVALAGFFAGFGVALRLSNALFCIAVGAYVLLSRWGIKRKVMFAACAFLPVAALLAYNFRVFGSAFGSYPAGWLLQGNVLAGVAGLLISPSRGLLVFCPVFLFSAVGVYLWLKGPSLPHTEIYWICLLVAATHIIAVGRWRLWYGGFSYGPRLLTDVVPCLVVLLIPAMRLLEVSRGWRFAFGAAFALSIFVQVVGAFYFPNGHWDALPQSVDQHHERLWDWRDNQILRSAKAGPVLVPYRLAWTAIVHPESLNEALRQQDVKVW